MSWPLMTEVTRSAVASALGSPYPFLLTPFTNWTREGTTPVPAHSKSDGEAHSTLELAYLHAGKCRMRLGDYTYHMSPGDFCLIPRRHRHREGPAMLDTTYRLLWFIFTSPDLGLFISEFRGREKGFYTYPGIWMNVGNSLEDTLERILLEERSANAFVEEIIRAQVLGLVAMVARQVELLVHHKKVPFPVTSGKLVQEIDRFVRKHYSDPELRVADMAKQVSLSANHFSDHFRRETGQSPYKYLLNTRLSVACELLTNTKAPIAAIAEKVGFRAPHHFSRVFKQFYGVSPSSYRLSCKPAVVQTKVSSTS